MCVYTYVKRIELCLIVQKLIYGSWKEDNKFAQNYGGGTAPILLLLLSLFTPPLKRKNVTKNRKIFNLYANLPAIHQIFESLSINVLNYL